MEIGKRGWGFVCTPKKKKIEQNSFLYRRDGRAVGEGGVVVHDPLAVVLCIDMCSHHNT